MTSKACPPNNSNPNPAGTSKKRRQATLYDAVAGRISTNGFIPEGASTGDLGAPSNSATPPEAVLFRRRKAPPRYEETDFYFASDSLPPRTLPDSDLLKALHGYTSDFYSRTMADDAQVDWRSMDETALLALGVLMEEFCRETLGDAGDMVFTEGQISTEPPMRRESVDTETEAQVKSDRTRRRKRRRLDRGDETH